MSNEKIQEVYAAVDVFPHDELRPVHAVLFAFLHHAHARREGRAVLVRKFHCVACYFFCNSTIIIAGKCSCFFIVGTRAFFFLIHGQIGKSLFYNPVVCYAVGFLTIYMASQTIMRYTKIKVSALHFRMLYCYIGVAILIGNFFWKNYYLVVKGIYLIP